MFWIIENIKGELLGAAEARFEDGNTLKILNFIIKRDYRYQGLGSSFLSKLEKAIINLKPSLITINLIPGGGSREFYERQGYRTNCIFVTKNI
jgi:histone acetyltransferase (RNA polymerase elongator complex component)